MLRLVQGGGAHQEPLTSQGLGNRLVDAIRLEADHFSLFFVMAKLVPDGYTRYATHVFPVEAQRMLRNRYESNPPAGF